MGSIITIEPTLVIFFPIIGHKIDYKGLGVLGGQRHIPSKNSPIGTLHQGSIQFFWYKQQIFCSYLIINDRIIINLHSIMVLLVNIKSIYFFKSIGSLRSYDGNCKENVSLKLNFALS